MIKRFQAKSKKKKKEKREKRKADERESKYLLKALSLEVRESTPVYDTLL